jgi:hypothetical protein
MYDIDENMSYEPETNTGLSNNAYNTCNQFLAIILLNFLEVFSRSNVM